MSDTDWPEFLYGKLPLDDYIALVDQEGRNRKDEIGALVRLIRDIAKYPYETGEETFKRISLICSAIHLLL